MKNIRRMGVLLITWLLMLHMPLFAWGEDSGPMFEAETALSFHLRAELGSAYQVIKVPAFTRVKIYDVQDGWYWVRYKDQMGWAKEKWLWAFRSLDAARYMVPGYTRAIGVVTLGEARWITGGEFKGVEVTSGSVLAVHGVSEEGYALRVWRGEGALARSAGQFTPFTAWQYARPGDLIGGFTTYYHERQGSPLHVERQYNIALGCSLADGTVLQPGDVFSFNALCGPYKKQKGYQMAKNISKDGKGWGGGICQLTTTLFNAALGLPLQITVWTPHRNTGVDYVPVSLDAAVGNSRDFQFINTLDYPIRIWTQPQGGAVTVLIYRAEE